MREKGVGGTERQGEKENPKQALCCAVRAEPDVGLELVNCEIMT